MSDYNSSLPVRTEAAGDIIAKLCDATTTSQQLKINADGSIDVNLLTSPVTVTATDLDIRDLVAATDSVSAWLKDASGNAFSNSNPLPVNIVAGETGTDVHDYKADNAVAAAATADHDYTVAGSILSFMQAICSGSGKARFIIKTGPTLTLVTKAVLYITTATPNAEVTFARAIDVAVGDIVRIEKKNLDNQAQDLHSTIIGYLN